MSEAAVEQAPAQEAPEQNLDYVQRTISSAIPESDRKYLGDEEPEKAAPEKPEKPEKAKTEKKPEIGDSEIPLDDDEPEKAVEEGEEEDEAPPEERTESDKAKAASKWKQYREAYRENPKLKSENQTLKAQLAKLGDQTETKTLREHVQALSQERQRLVALVEQGNIENSEVWEAHVTTPLNEMWEDIQAIAQRNGMDAEHLAKLVQNKDDKVLNNYMDEHETGPGDKNYLFGMIQGVNRIDKTKKYLREHSHELSQKSQQETAARRDEYFKHISAVRTQAVESIVPKIQEKILNVLPKDKRRNLQNDVKHILNFEKWEPDIQMFAGVAAVVLPDLLDSYNLLRGQLREAKGELIKFRGGGPKITTGGKTPRVVEEEAPKPEALAKTSLTDFADDSTRRIRQALGYRK